MEILNNFDSIYCFIAFIIGAVFMLVINSIEAMGNSKKLKVKFYIKRVHGGLELWMADQRGVWYYIMHMEFGDDHLIDTESFRGMEYDEITEINLMEE